MDSADVLQVCRAVPKARVIAVHMEAITIVLTRAALREAVSTSPQKPTVAIPGDGDVLTLV